MTGSNVNQVVTILKRCAAKSIEWASRRGLQFDTTNTDTALCMRRRGHKKHLRPQPTAEINIENGFIRLNKHATRWLGVLMAAHLTSKEHHNRWMKNITAAGARLRTLLKTFGVVPESVSAIQVACVQAVALDGSELWWDPKEVDRRDDLQLLLNGQAISVLGALPTAPRVALIRESGLTPVLVILDSSQQRFAARLANAGSSKPKELHKHAPSGKPICQVVEIEQKRGWTTDNMIWLAQCDDPVVNRIILDDQSTANRAAQCWEREKEAKVGVRVWIWLTDRSPSDDGQVEAAAV